MDKAELVKIMQSGANKKSKEIEIPKTHDPDMEHRVLTKAEMKPAPGKVEDVLPEPEEIAKVEVKRKYEPATEIELLRAILLQSKRTNELLVHVRNKLIDRDFNWKTPEEVNQNGEIS